MSRAEKAKEYFLSGYACSQAVALAFSDVMGMDEATIAKIMLPYGGGLSRLRLTCGTVSGMAAVVGMVFAESENTPENKKQTYAIMQELCAKFKEKMGSLVCAELLAKMKEDGFYELCPRDDFVNESSVIKWHKLGFNVRAWNIKNQEIMARVYDSGADGMTVNFPDKLLDYIASKL